MTLGKSKHQQESLPFSISQVKDVLQLEQVFSDIIAPI